MNEKTQRKIFQYFNENIIENFVGVPDSTLKHFIDEGLKKKKIIIANREEEAIGISTGMILAGSPTLMFMQNAGFANSISTITSLIQLYEIPIIFTDRIRGESKLNLSIIYEAVFGLISMKFGQIFSKMFK